MVQDDDNDELPMKEDELPMKEKNNVSIEREDSGRPSTIHPYVYPVIATLPATAGPKRPREALRPRQQGFPALGSWSSGSQQGSPALGSRSAGSLAALIKLGLVTLPTPLPADGKHPPNMQPAQPEHAPNMQPAQPHSSPVQTGDEGKD